MHNFNAKIDGKFIRITHGDFGRFNIPLFNTKVRVPIINVETAKECVNKKTCPFSTRNFKKTGYPWCYSQKIETVFPNTYKWKKQNNRMLGAFTKFSSEIEKSYTLELVKAIAESLNTYATFIPYVRINESGDISEENIFFFIELQKELSKHGKKIYGYTKSSEEYRRQLNDLGACIIRSEKDFVMVNNEQEAIDKGMQLCPGTCGPCTKCMNYNGTPIAVVRH